MEPTADAYYVELARDYERTIRWLVPHHEEMVEAGIGLFRQARPRRVLDLGMGPGGGTARLLEALPGATVVGVERSAAMLERAARTLAPWADRVTMIDADVTDFEAEAPFDGVYTNLVLHNLSPGARTALLERIRGWLAPGGLFVWGDLIRFADPALQDRWVGYRRDHALASGCPAALVEWNFRKEAEEDFPLTVEEAVRAGRDAGFGACEVVWSHDTFALLRADPEGGG